MPNAKPSHNVSTKVSGSFSRLHRIVLAVTALLAVVSTLRVIFDLGYNYGAFDQSDLVHRTCCIGFLESYVIPITLGLIISAGCMSIRKPVARIFSLLGLLWILLSYFLWYRGTQAIIQAAEVETFRQLPGERQYLLPLSYASLWDIAVIAIVIILLIWHIKILGRLGRQFVSNHRSQIRNLKTVGKRRGEGSDEQLDNRIITPELPMI
jgi:hypothetical protein